MPDAVGGTSLTVTSQLEDANIYIMHVPKLKDAKSEVLFYDKFNKETDTCAGESAVESIKGYLGSSLNYANKGNDIDKIGKAICYVDKMYKGTDAHPYKKELCHALYFWIGDILFNNVKDSDSLSLIISMICEQLHNSYTQHGCEIICETIGKDLFLKRKTIFDYYHDYSVIQTAILNHEEAPCAQLYSQYLDAIIPIYEGVRSGCGGVPTSGSYCEQFKKCLMILMIQNSCN
ncbi:Variable surface protein Vir7-like protein [Plasmodium coatneyi]|uniref:Variable surface protein Vir7-like protein n=1 Tax=Plasmodium coatneyi TaxID=208452 RepID=A0A1B1E1Q8_9APIC|nr:Variable surface protein Vir7-like protein [Plasmodium coatneyi]ANQ08972.1 Variable surface protein Vir7-like protein [Plasmodium coatneyi]